MVGLENFELAGIKTYTRFWGLLMFGSYSVINVIVLLNLLIAMMSNSYAMIDEHSDVEWKFARTRLWMRYFEEGATLPPPFNILPTPKLFCKLFGMRKKDKMRKMKLKEQKEKENDVRYAAVMRALVWRYVSAKHRKLDEEPVTEDDINELKGDVSALRYELLEVFEKNGMDVSFTDRKEKTVLAKRMKIWERRLMKDFQVAPVPPVEDDERPENETGLSRFRRIARMAVASTTNSMWDKTLAGAGISTQIGRCRTRESFKNQQNLQKAMDEARKLVLRSPLPEGSRGHSPIEMPLAPGHTLLELIKDISTEIGLPPGNSTPRSKSPWKGENYGPSSGGLLTPNFVPSRAASPVSRIPSPLPSGNPSPIPSLEPPARPLSPACEIEKPTTKNNTSPFKTSMRSHSDLTQKTPRKKAPEKPNLSDEQGELDSKEITPLAVARPVALEIKPAEGALPPPPAKPKAPIAPVMEITPSSPYIRSGGPSTPKITSSTAKVVLRSRPSSRPSSPQPKCTTPCPKSPPSPPARSMSTSSTEQLILSPGPKTLRPINKIDEVNTIKRQTKTGWL
ncbi:unnamed protein product, partial [Iphiclides podalirius]